MAVAVQISGMDIQLIVASNNSLPDSTITHLKEVWNILTLLSRDYQDHHRVPENSVSPKPPAVQDLSKDAQMRVGNLSRKILRFGHQKLRRRVSKDYFNLISVNQDVAKEIGLELVIRLLKIIKPALDKPALPDKIWDHIGTILEHIRLQFYEISDAIKKHQDDSLIPFPLFQYLSKVVSVCEDITALLKAANSPPLASLFNRDFRIVNLQGSGDISFNLPDSRAGWTQLVEDTLRWRNMAAKAKGEVKFQLVKSEVQQHAQRMCGKPLRNTNFVHCELNVISYILNGSEEGFLDYIGVSKLCCWGCAQYIQAVEHVLGKRFKIRGTHQKFYYPWAFPDIPRASSVAERMRSTISFVFGQTYKGFFPDTKAYLSDSGATESSGDDKKGMVKNCHPLDEAITGMLEFEGVCENTDMDGRKRKKRKAKV